MKSFLFIISFLILPFVERDGELFAQSTSQQFSVTVFVPDLPEGAEASLRNHGNYDFEDITTRVSHGMLSFKGTIEGATLAELRINDKAFYAKDEYPKERAVKFMLSDTSIVISAPRFDMMPRRYELGGTPLTNELNVKVSGGEIQRHYEEWRRYIHSASLATWQCEHVAWEYQYGGNYRGKRNIDKQLVETMNKATRAAKRTLQAMTDKFIAEHPSYAVSLAEQREKLKQDFRYDAEEIDEMVKALKDNEDSKGYSNLCYEAERAKKFLKGSLPADFKLETAEGKTTTLASVLSSFGMKNDLSSTYKKGEGKLFLIDFWASWCAPCRASIPALKELYASTRGKLEVISISVDNKEEDWKHAMEDEQMPWIQLRSMPAEMALLKEKYNLQSIPTLLILSPEGKIILSTHNAYEAHETIEKHLQSGKF